MIAVLAIADGADGEDDLGVGTMAAEQVDGSTQVVGTLVDGKLLLLEEGGGAFRARWRVFRALERSLVGGKESKAEKMERERKDSKDGVGGYKRRGPEGENEDLMV